MCIKQGTLMVFLSPPHTHDGIDINAPKNYYDGNINISQL